MSRKIIYSALVGDYDHFPKHFILQNDEWEHILFTDSKFENNIINGWKIKPLSHIIKEDNVKTARWHKLNPHLLFDDCLFSVWIDSNIKILDDYIYKRSQYLFNKETIIASVKHPERDCIYEEAKECLVLGKDKKENINSIVNFLKEERYPRNLGLFESNLLFRNHNYKQINNYNELWWSYLDKYTRRDQLTMCLVLWKMNITCDIFFEESNITTRNSDHFLYSQNHKIQNNYIEISQQILIDKDTKIHEKNLEIIDKQGLLNQKELENLHYKNLLENKEQENQQHIQWLHNEQQENQKHIHLLSVKQLDNKHYKNLLDQKMFDNKLLIAKIKRIKNTISYKVFFKIEIFFRDLIK